MDEISNTNHKPQNQKAFDNKPGNSGHCLRAIIDCLTPMLMRKDVLQM
jgi:hypothetical protein